jgi:hypothetical protein
LIANGILRRRGNDFVVDNNKILKLQRVLQPDMLIHISRARVLNRNTRNYFLAVDEPIFQNPNL